MIPNLLTAIVLMGAAAPLISALKSWFSRKASSPVQIRTGSGNVTLDLARDLPPEQINALLQQAIRSVSKGDKAGVLKTVNDSHAASNSVRLAGSEAPR